MSENTYIPGAKIHSHNKQLFSMRAILLSSLFGGIIAGTYFLYQNFKIFGQAERGKKIFLVGIVIEILLAVLFGVLPSQITDRIPSLVIPVASTALIYSYAKTYQEKEIDSAKLHGIKMASVWKIIGISILSLIITIVLSVGIALLLPENHGECKVPEKSKNSQLYDQYEATCFIYKHQNGNTLTWDEIDYVLTLEFDYQKTRGMINSTNGTVLNYDPLPYIKEHNKKLLEDSKIEKILVLEEGYLKFLGVQITVSQK